MFPMSCFSKQTLFSNFRFRAASRFSNLYFSLSSDFQKRIGFRVRLRRKHACPDRPVHAHTHARAKLAVRAGNGVLARTCRWLVKPTHTQRITARRSEKLYSLAQGGSRLASACGKRNHFCPLDEQVTGSVGSSPLAPSEKERERVGRTVGVGGNAGSFARLPRRWLGRDSEKRGIHPLAPLLDRPSIAQASPFGPPLRSTPACLAQQGKTTKKKS